MKLFRIINGQAQEYHNVIADAFFVVVSATEGGEVNGGGLYGKGELVTVTTEGEDFYNFLGWYHNGIKVSSLKKYTFTATDDVTLEARYEYTQTK